MSADLNKHQLSFRTIQREDGFRTVLDTDTIDVKSEIDYDLQGNHQSSINYFASALIGAVMLSISSEAKRKGIFIDDIEAKSSFELINPLTALHVRGYNEPPYIGSCDITLYMYSELEEASTLSLINDALKLCFMYQTLKKAFPIRIRFVPVL